MWAASLRLALATVLLGAIALLLRHPFPRGAALRAALGYGVLQFGLNFALLYWGEKTFPSGLTAVLYATIPLSTALMAAATGLERLTRARVSGAIVAVAGVALLFHGQPLGGIGLVPAVALFAAATLAAWSSLILKRGPRQSPVWATAVASLAGSCSRWAMISGVTPPWLTTSTLPFVCRLRICSMAVAERVSFKLQST